MSKHEYTKEPCDACGRRSTEEETIYTRMCTIGHQDFFGKQMPVSKMLCRICRHPENVVSARILLRAQLGIQA